MEKDICQKFHKYLCNANTMHQYTSKINQYHVDATDDDDDDDDCWCFPKALTLKNILQCAAAASNFAQCNVLNMHSYS